MKILFLAPRFPLPADTGGKIRTWNILKQLAKTNQVTLVCFAFDKVAPSHLEDLRKLNIETELVAGNDPSIAARAWSLMFDSLPASIAKYKSSEMAEAIKKAFSAKDYDAAHIDHLHMAVYRDCFGDLPCFLDEHNVEYKILERCSDVETSPVKRFFYKQQAAKMKVFESRMLTAFQGVLACSLHDQLLLKELCQDTVPVHIIPNGVDTGYFNLRPNTQKEPGLVFTGSMDWLPNDDAINYFCKEILPLVREKQGSLKLHVVGKNPSKPLQELSGRDKHVIVTGRVDDVRPFMESSSIFITPLRIGGGTRLKILEAMAMGKAVVSTTVGAEGIECEDGVHIAIADHPKDFAQKIIDLCRQPEKAAAMGQEGRDLVCKKYDWEIIGQNLNAIYAEAVHAV